MESVLVKAKKIINLESLTHGQAKELLQETVWKNLADITMGQAVDYWLSQFSATTALNYLSGIKILVANGLLDLDVTLQRFALFNHNTILDQIKLLPNQSEASKQARAACYISLTRFLSRQTQGLIARAIPCREGTTKTFFKVRDKVKTNAMTHKQWNLFLHELHNINERDCLIAKLLLQGGKRMNEVLSLTTDQINFDACEITFNQSKTKGYCKQTVISYAESTIDKLSDYLCGRTGLVFVTRTGKRVMQRQLAVTFALAGVKAGIAFKVTPHVLRASTITYLKREGFADSCIMKVSGHSSAEMVHAYDKSERADNPTRIVKLVD